MGSEQEFVGSVELTGFLNWEGA